MKWTIAIILAFTGLNAMAGSKEAEIINRECGNSIGAYLDMKPIFEDDRGIILKGFGAYWNEDHYLDKSGTVSVLFSSENVIYFYYEDSDVAGEVYRCDTRTGAITVPFSDFSHYPSCNNVKKSTDSEANRGTVYFDYCSENPQE
ncbi:MAG: hypothetical protein K0R29_921 [Pseudobdellovibrio sp.]|jgi:hypothetical protein|nr:hypothetical protein [Pseudobdellovibrio sp.]